LFEVDFVATPLSQVLQVLREETDCFILLDLSALEDKGIDPDSPVTIRLPACSLREALSLICKPYGLVVRVREVGLEISTVSATHTPPSLRFYDLSYIFPSSEMVPNLITTIEKSISPDNWAISGGINTLSMIGSVMVIRADEEVHFEVEGLLKSIATMNPGNRTPGISLPNTGGGMF
jgi:hypothetical protein